jgi:ribonuclease HI
MAWRWMMLRDARVLARCDEAGALRAESGRVEIRYRAQDGKAYRAALANLTPVAGAEILPDEHCADAEPAPKAGASKIASKTASQTRSATVVHAAPDHGTDTIIAYTDGACSGNPGPAGLGVVLTHGKVRRELSEYLGVATNNIAELTAILRALEVLDSQYAIGVLQKGWKAKVNQELIATTKQRMRSFTKLKLVYVKGHAGIPLNERADELARQAVSERANRGWLEVKSDGDIR